VHCGVSAQGLYLPLLTALPVSSSRHHSDLRGFSVLLGWVNLRVQVSWGTVVHSSLGFRLGTSLVTRRQVFWGLRSQVSSGTSTSVSTVLSWHSSGPSSVTHPEPQILRGSFSHLVSPTNLPGPWAMYLVEQELSKTVLHSSGP